MSRDRMDTLREQGERLMEAINARDFDALARDPWFHPEFQFHSALSAAEGHYHVGVSGLREWAESMDSVWAEFHVTITDLRELQDGRLLVTYRATGKARGSGMPLDTQTAQVWSLRDGRLWHSQSYTDPREAFEAVGLPH